MTREDTIRVEGLLQFVCTCLCGFQRRCTSIEDAQATASRHADRCGGNPVAEPA